MGIAHAGVDAGHYHVLAAVAHGPYIGCIDEINVTSGVFYAGRGACCGLRVIENQRLGAADVADTLHGHHPVERFRVAAFDQNRIADPIGDVGGSGCIQRGACGGLGRVGLLHQGVVDVPAARRPVQRAGHAQIDGIIELDPIVGRVVGLEVFQNLRFELADHSRFAEGGQPWFQRAYAPRRKSGRPQLKIVKIFITRFVIFIVSSALQERYQENDLV